MCATTEEIDSAGRAGPDEAKRYRTLLAINNALVANLTREELFHAISRALRRVVPFDRAALFLHDPRKGLLRLMALETGSIPAGFAVGFAVAPEESHMGRAFVSKQRHIRGDLAAAREFPLEERLLEEGFRSYVVLPLLARGRSIGTLNIASRTAHRFSEDDAAFLQEIANQIGLAIENMHAYEEIAELNARLATPAERYRTLLEINNAVITNLTREDLLRAAFRALHRALTFDGLGLTLYDPALDGFRFYAIEGSGTERFGEGQVLDRQNCCFGEAFDTGRPVLRRDLRKERVYSTDDQLLEAGIHSYCTVPLVVQRRSIGAISVISRDIGRFSEADAEFLQEMAHQVALAVANMQSFEENRALRARLQAENILLQENAALFARFAAALSHDLNSPLGALKSALQTGVLLAERKDELPPEVRAHEDEIDAQLRRTALDSADRIHQTVLRMQRFTNLDRNHVVAADANALIRDVADLIGTEIRGGVNLKLDLAPLPPLVLRPQPINAVLLTLLHNAVGNGSTNVRVTTRDAHPHVKISIQDDGLGMSPEQLAGVFDPSFRTIEERVSTGNWSLFSARQIVREHGGHIEIHSSPGQGTTVHLLLPRVQPTAAVPPMAASSSRAHLAAVV